MVLYLYITVMRVQNRIATITMPL